MKFVSKFVIILFKKIDKLNKYGNIIRQFIK